MANENDLNGKVGLDVTDFKASVAELNRQVRVIESGFKAVAAGMDDWRTTSTGLEARIDSLTKVTDLQRQKIGNLTNEYLKIVEAKGKDSKAAQNLEIRINKETESLNKNELEIKKCNEALSSLDTGSKKAENEVKDLGNEMNEASKHSNSLKGMLSGLGTHLKGAFIGAVKIATTAVVGLGVTMGAAAVGAFKLSEKASDLVEAQNVVESTFKTSSKAIEDWSNTTANSAGISKTASTQWAGFMGSMLKSSGITESSAANMSKSLVQLTGDMSSFYNVGNDEMWEKIRSGISGETEPLKQLGINMSVANLEAYALSSGIKKSYKEMSQAEQTTLRYNYLMSVTKDAQGDFAKTLGSSFANQVRVAKMNLESLGMSIGQIFLPSVMNMTKSLNQSFTEINKIFADGFQQSDIGKLSSIFSGMIQKAVAGIATTIPQVLPVIITSLNTLISSIVQTIPTLLPQLLQGVMQLMASIGSVLQQNMQPLSNLAIMLIAQLVTGILQGLPQLIPIAAQMITTLTNGLRQASPQITSVATEFVTNLANGFIANIGTIVDAGTKLMPVIVQIITSLINGLTQTLPQLIPVAVKAILSLANGLISNIGTIVDAGIKLILALAQGIINSLPTLIQEVPKLINDFSSAIYAQLPKILKAGIDLLLILIKGIIDSIPVLIANLPQIILAIVNVITLFNWASLGKGLITKIGEGISSMASGIANIARSVASGIENGISGIFKGGLSWGKSLILNVGDGISSMASSISSIASRLASGVTNSISSIFTNGPAIGKALIQGIWNGITSVKDWILSKIGGFAGNIIHEVKSRFGINSPSRVMRDQVGKFLPAGIALGISDNAKVVDDAMARMSKKVTGNFTTSLQVGDNVSGNNPTTQNNNDILDAINKLADAVKNYKPKLYLDAQEVAIATGPYDNQIQGQYSKLERRVRGL